MSGWIGVDLDGTLAQELPHHDPLTIGPPVPAMVDKVRQALGMGYEVRIFTARVSHPDLEMVQQIKVVIQQWSFQNIGSYLAVTNQKDYGMLESWDDRAVQVEHNTGEFVGESALI